MCVYSVKAVKMCIDWNYKVSGDSRLKRGHPVSVGKADWHNQRSSQTSRAQFVSTEVHIQELELLTDIILFFMDYNSVRKQMSKSAINIYSMLGSEDSSVGKMLAIKPDNLNSMPETHMVEGEKYFAVIFWLFHACCGT